MSLSHSTLFDRFTITANFSLFSRIAFGADVSQRFHPLIFLEICRTFLALAANVAKTLWFALVI